MKKALTLLAILAVVGTASATVRVFVTTSSDGYGLENPANHMVPTISSVDADGNSINGYDYQDYYGVPGPLRPGAFPPGDAPSGDLANPVQILDGDWAYIWLQFQNEAKGAKINGLQVTISVGVTTTAGNETVDAAVARADRALYAAKESGRNRVKYYAPDFFERPVARAC